MRMVGGTQSWPIMIASVQTWMEITTRMVRSGMTGRLTNGTRWRKQRLKCGEYEHASDKKRWKNLAKQKNKKKKKKKKTLYTDF